MLGYRVCCMRNEAIEESRLDHRRELNFKKGNCRFCNDGNEMFSPFLGRCNWMPSNLLLAIIPAQWTHSLELCMLIAISYYAAIYERVHEATDQGVILVEIV